MFFINARNLLDLCVKHGILKTDKDGNILVYREASKDNPAQYPEGWYAEHINDLAQDLMYDSAGQTLLINAPSKVGVTFHESNLHFFRNERNAIHIQNGNILNVETGIICHQVNCRHAMGSGLALKIRKKYPCHYADYLTFPAKLGNICLTEIRPDELHIAGIYAQDEYGSHGIHTQYPALASGLSTVNKIAEKKHLPVYLPYGIGCGLGGGDWEIVKTIIRENVKNAIILQLKS